VAADTISSSPISTGHIAGIGIGIGQNVNVNVHIEKLVTGLERLPTDYAARVQRFFEEYLGTPASPVPFGGRQEELAALDDWLADLAAPPYALLTAGAGRGKSALLAQWVQTLLAHDRARVVAIPISIRFGTALASVAFSALAVRLGEIYADPVKHVDLSGNEWREVCSGYLRRSPPPGPPVVVILDGLDEAADWRAGPDLFPLTPPAGLRVIVSARYVVGDVDERGWLRRLGWDPPGRARSFALPVLTVEGVRDVLGAMGEPLDRLVPRVDVVGELSRVSQGDPLLVRLYVEALLPSGDRSATLTPQDLPSIANGLEGYFERWWGDQLRLWEAQGQDPLVEQADVLHFLNLCAVALGPLSRDEIAAIANGGLASGLRLERVAAQVERFIIGDGKTQGYIFSHPRLGQFFCDKMIERERAEYEARFLSFGRRTLESLEAGTLEPSAAMSYAVQYFGAHLEQASASLRDFDALVTPSWFRAWEALTGTFSGFLNDVGRAWLRARTVELTTESDYQPTIGLQCRYALVTVSVAPCP
jgi:hypothetical protein